MVEQKLFYGVSSFMFEEEWTFRVVVMSVIGLWAYVSLYIKYLGFYEIVKGHTDFIDYKCKRYNS